MEQRKMFKEKIVMSLKKRYQNSNKEVDVEIKQITKNNNLKLDAVVIRGDEVTGAVPTIYLKDFYDMYLNGMSIDDIADKIQKIYEENKMENINVEDFMNFELIKDRIKVRIINFEMNKELLEDCPFKKFLDLAVVCYVDVKGDKTATALIHNNNLRMWEIDSDKLFEIAKENNGKEKYTITPMSKIIVNMFCENDSLDDEDEIYKYLEDEELEQQENNEDEMMYVVTNKEKIFGAAGILEKNVLDRIYNIFKQSFFIIASSIQEVICIPANSQWSASDIRKMTEEVNNTEVAKNEILSYNCYFVENGIVTIA